MRCSVVFHHKLFPLTGVHRDHPKRICDICDPQFHARGVSGQVWEHESQQTFDGVMRLREGSTAGEIVAGGNGAGNMLDQLCMPNPATPFILT